MLVVKSLQIERANSSNFITVVFEKTITLSLDKTQISFVLTAYNSRLSSSKISE